MTDDEWHPIETVPISEHVLLWFPTGESGIGGMECATVYWDDGEWMPPDGEHKLSFWTHGGPNAGDDWEPVNGEMPTHWRRLPVPPK